MMWEIYGWEMTVTSREGRVSRNTRFFLFRFLDPVTSREGRVSRNIISRSHGKLDIVTSREGRVSRNAPEEIMELKERGHVPRGTCE